MVAYHSNPAIAAIVVVNDGRVVIRQVTEPETRSEESVVAEAAKMRAAEAAETRTADAAKMRATAKAAKTRAAKSTEMAAAAKVTAAPEVTATPKVTAPTPTMSAAAARVCSAK
jgi:hypothetical protein